MNHKFSNTTLLSEYILESVQTTYEIVRCAPAIPGVPTGWQPPPGWRELVQSSEITFCGNYDFDHVICKSLEHEQSVFINELKNSIKATKQLFIIYEAKDKIRNLFHEITKIYTEHDVNFDFILINDNLHHRILNLEWQSSSLFNRPKLENDINIFQSYILHDDNRFKIISNKAIPYNLIIGCSKQSCVKIKKHDLRITNENDSFCCTQNFGIKVVKPAEIFGLCFFDEMF